MSITQNSKILWSDIQALYTSLNTQKTRFGQATITIPNNVNKQAMAKDASDLVAAVESMASVSWIGSVAFTGATIPSVGDYITPDLFKKVETTIKNIENVFANNNGFGAHVTFSSDNSFSDFVSFSSNNSFSDFVSFSSNNAFSFFVSFTSNVDFCARIDFGTSC